MSINQLDELGKYLENLMNHIDEINSSIMVVPICTMKLEYETIYFKNQIELTEEKYVDVLVKKELSNKRIEWFKRSKKVDDINRETNDIKPEQSDFDVAISATKARLSYRGELVLNMINEKGFKKETNLTTPIKDSIEIDLENKRISFIVKTNWGDGRMYDYGKMYDVCIDWKREFKQMFILENSNYIITYRMKVEMIQPEFSIIPYNKMKKIFDYGALRTRENQLKREIQATINEENPKSEEVRKRRKRSINELIEVHGINKKLEKMMGIVDMTKPEKRMPVIEEPEIEKRNEEDHRLDILYRWMRKQKDN